MIKIVIVKTDCKTGIKEHALEEFDGTLEDFARGVVSKVQSNKAHALISSCIKYDNLRVEYRDRSRQRNMLVQAIWYEAPQGYRNRCLKTVV